MARSHEDPDGVGRVIDLFPAGSRKAIERMLKRARDKEAKQAGRAVGTAMRGVRSPKLGLGRLAGELGRALKQRGAPRDRPSVRQVSPKSGGRPFHFAHNVVRKEDAPGPASAKGGSTAAGTAPGRSSSGKGTGRAAAHMRYIEREIAVERLYGQGLADGREAVDAFRGRTPDAERGVEAGIASGRGPGAAHASSAGAGQGYVENPVKLENGERVTFSFETIGERFEDRVAFWEALERAEAHPQTRVQHRLIVELPHEASPEARFEMVRRFCARFEDDGAPYWAALHAPGTKNDGRNFHAHVVYSERPAKRVVDPVTKREVWDFEVVKEWTDSSRHARTSRPLRQDKLRAYHDRDFIKERRKEFSDIVNGVLSRDEVTF